MDNNEVNNIIQRLGPLEFSKRIRQLHKDIDCNSGWKRLDPHNQPASGTYMTLRLNNTGLHLMVNEWHRGSWNIDYRDNGSTLLYRDLDENDLKVFE